MQKRIKTPPCQNRRTLARLLLILVPDIYIVIKFEFNMKIRIKRQKCRIQHKVADSREEADD